MYYIYRYDDETGNFVPARDSAFKLYRFDSWEDASEKATSLTVESGFRERYKVEFNTIRRKNRARR